MASASCCGVAPFRVVAPCPAPQKPHTLPRPTAGFRIISTTAGSSKTEQSKTQEREGGGLGHLCSLGISGSGDRTEPFDDIILAGLSPVKRHLGIAGKRGPAGIQRKLEHQIRRYGPVAGQAGLNDACGRGIDRGCLTIAVVALAGNPAGQEIMGKRDIIRIRGPIDRINPERSALLLQRSSRLNPYVQRVPFEASSLT